jgi:hypothetical protein
MILRIIFASDNLVAMRVMWNSQSTDSVLKCAGRFVEICEIVTEVNAVDAISKPSTSLLGANQLSRQSRTLTVSDRFRGKGDRGVSCAERAIKDHPDNPLYRRFKNYGYEKTGHDAE